MGGGDPSANIAWDYRIPQFAHVIAKAPADLGEEVALCLQANPGWQFWLYDDARMVAFVAGEYPELLGRFLMLGRVVEQTDVMRYLLLHR